MAIDFNAVAQAIAARFAAAQITPPTGENDIALSTEALPSNIVQEPTVLVFPPEVECPCAGSPRSGPAVFPVRFYLFRIRDNARNATLTLKWLGSLYQQLDGQAHLALSDYVATATISGMVPGRLSYGGDEFEGIELSVAVQLWEGLSAGA